MVSDKEPRAEGSVRVLLADTAHFDTVQGSTEPYYIHKWMKKRYAVDAYTFTSNEVTDNEDIVYFEKNNNLPWSLVPTWFQFDAKLLRHVVIDKDKSYDLVWTYKGIFLTPAYLKIKDRSKWIMDIRTPPVSQKSEFRSIGSNKPFAYKIEEIILTCLYFVFFRLCDEIITVSRQNKKFISGKYCLDKKNIYVQTLGVDTKKFQEIKDLRLENRIGIACVTSVTRQRKIGKVVEIAECLKKRNSSVMTYIVGSGDKKYVKEIEEKIDIFGLNEQVKMTGYKNHDRVVHTLSKCHIGLSPLPNLQSFRLSSPAKVFEYMAMGLTVIASDIPAHREILEHGETGIIVSDNKATSWAEHIVHLINNKSELERIGKNARKEAIKYDWDNMLEHLDKSILSPDF